MAEFQLHNEVDELAVALVAALARQDGDLALALSASMVPLIGDRLGLQARHAAWTAQAHQLQGQTDQALIKIREAIALATTANDPEAVAALKGLKVQIVTGKAAAAQPGALPLPDTLLGRAVAAMDSGDHDTGAGLARQARIEAQSTGNARDEVLSLLAMARICGQEDSAIRAAYRVADASDDKNLVTAVARAARAAAISLPKKVF
jgi:hypothetical protein